MSGQTGPEYGFGGTEQAVEGGNKEDESLRDRKKAGYGEGSGVGA